jgi:hypothetical protein
MFSGAMLEKNLKKFSKKSSMRQAEKEIVGAAFTLADAGAKAVTPSP